MDQNNETSISEQVGSRLDDLFGDDGEQTGVLPEKDTDLEESASPSPAETSGGTVFSNRLDDFFEKDKASENPGEDKDYIDPVDIENSIIKDLKSVILSLEWEITDQVMQKLGEEITNLEGQCKNDKIVVAFLQLLGSLGKYIRKKRADAHPDSIRLLHSVYENLEIALLSKKLTDTEKKKLLVSQVEQYKKLKEEIITAKTSAPSQKRISDQPEEGKVSIGKDSESESYADGKLRVSGKDDHIHPEKISDIPEAAREILKALENIRKTIQTGFSDLKRELRQIKE